MDKTSIESRLELVPWRRRLADRRSDFPFLPTQAWKKFPDFLEVIEHFVRHGAFAPRQDTTLRSTVEFEGQGPADLVDWSRLNTFFGLPKTAGDWELESGWKGDPVVQRLNGIQPGQTLYIQREPGVDFRFYASVWPWQREQGRFTLHLGVETTRNREYAEHAIRQIVAEMWLADVHDIPND
ncbi:MAG: hypothetical protein H6683_02680 [Deltaproteobacteria bacterium]|nr:hypothetical protein [Deltaproteobacteria bacterium]